MNRKVRAITVDGTEIMTSLTAVEIADKLRTYDDLKDEVNGKDNIINELEKYLENRNSFFKEMSRDYGTHQDLLDENENILDKLKELKENGNNE